MITRKSVQFAVVGAIALAAVTAGAAAAQDKVVRPRAGVAGEWRLLGQVTANFKADHDTIVVRGPYDNFNRLDVRQRFEKGGESRVIDLRGAGKRSIRRVDFWYDTAGVLQGRADVTLFGLK
jgi:hypothetical protein